MNFIQTCVRQGVQGHLYLMSGDFDMKPLVDEALKNRCQVTLISWRRSLSSHYTKNNDKRINIIYLDGKADEFVFFEKGRKKIKPKKRTYDEALNQTSTISLLIIGMLVVAVIIFAFLLLK